MSGERNEQAETAVLMADTAGGVTLDVPDMEDPPAEIHNASEELAASESSQSCPGFLLRILAIFCCCSGDNKSVTVPRAAGSLANEVEGFILGVWRYERNILGKELPAHREESLRQLLPLWNIFLQSVQGIPGTSAIISMNIKGDIDEFIPWWEEKRGVQRTVEDNEWIKRWLPRWNMFLQARAGQTLVTRWNVCLTIVGFLFYIVDLGSDISTAMYYASNGQWWWAIVTLTLVYGGVIFYTGWKWIYGYIPCTGAAAWLRYVVSLLVNWPDVQQYGALCLLEWKLHKSPVGRARLVVEWHGRRVRVAFLKFTEGVWEACPQAMLQLYLLVPDLYGDRTWTDYLRIASASVSLCTAGAALVNREKCRRIDNHTDVPLRELVVLYVWAGPVTVARLLSVALLLTVHPYWALTGVVLHLVLSGVHRCRTEGGPRTRADVINIFLNTLRLCVSPFTVDGSVTTRRLYHATQFLVNTAVTVVWALGTPLVCAHPALYTAILCFNAAMFAVGMVGMELHWMFWRHSYP